MKVSTFAYDGPSDFYGVGRRVGRNRYELPGGAHLRVVDVPAGTHGFEDLCRGADLFTTQSGGVRVASVVDLLRIADASRSKTAYRDALAYQAVLDVRQAKRKARAPDDRSPAEKIDAALWGRTLIPT
jgi:hypothetical protein